MFIIYVRHFVLVPLLIFYMSSIVYCSVAQNTCWKIQQKILIARLAGRLPILVAGQCNQILIARLAGRLPILVAGQCKLPRPPRTQYIEKSYSMNIFSKTKIQSDKRLKT